MHGIWTTKQIIDIKSQTFFYFKLNKKTDHR